MTRHTSEWKKKEVQELSEMVKQYKVVAVADLERFPASLFQELRKKLQGKAIVKVSKTRIIKKALGEAKLDGNFAEYIKGSVAVIFTNLNPFELYSFLKKNKGDAPAKAGMIAPNDIIVPKGDTGLPPGPALSDLKAAGLNPRIQGSTITIPKDVVVAKKGEVVSEAVAGTLAKLDIKPIKVGLNIVAALENGQVFTSEVLDIDTEEVFDNFVNAYRNAFNLAFNVEYFIPETVELFIVKGFNEAKAVAFEAKVFTKETIENLMAKANAQAKSLKAMFPEKPVKEEKKTEQAEKKESNESEKEKKVSEEKPEEEKSKEIEEKEKTEKVGGKTEEKREAHPEKEEK